jgi:hypothetical protein
MPWFKGNTHTHSFVSDGDSAPPVVCAWYKAHGYDFLCMTDHNHPFDAAWLVGTGIADSSFLVIPGVEITTVAEGLPVHLNGLGISVMPELPVYSSIEALLQGSIDSIRALGGVPIVNHPNFYWALTPKHLLGLNNCNLFEIWNASTNCNNLGAGGKPSTDDFWNGLLTAGQTWHGIASDDAHDFAGEFWGYKSLPGQAFIVVNCEKLEQQQILAALEAGHFYSSTGIMLETLEMSDSTVQLEIQAQHHYTYTSELLAPNGEVLATQFGTKVEFHLPEDITSARVRIFDSDGSRLWTNTIG